jgi:AraC-like DNA-binding protein
MLAYIQSHPTVFSENPMMTIWVMIDEKVIKRDLRNISTDGWAYVIDESGNVIASLSMSKNNLEVDTIDLLGKEGFSNQVINGQRMIVSHTSSSYNGWKYISVAPYSVVMAKTQFVRLLLIGIGIAVMILGLITAYLLALRSTKPLKELVNLIKEKLPAASLYYKNEYDFIKKNVREISEMNRSLQREMQQQIPMLRASFFERLFRGEYTVENEILTVLRQLGINFRGSFYSVALLRINVYDNSISNGILGSLFTAKAVIKNMVSRKFSSRLYIHDRAEDELALLLCFSTSESDVNKAITEKLLLELYDELYKKYSIHSSYAVGNLYPNLKDVWHSYRESIEVLDTMRISKDFGINWYEEQIESGGGYYYPLNLEERLMNNVKAGNSEEVRNILDLIYRENIENRKLSSDMLRLLMHNMRCSIIKVLNQIDLNDNDSKKETIEKVEALRHCETFNDAFKTIEDIYESICGVIDSLKKSHKIELIESIKKYIQEQHRELGLNRYEVANKFGMTEKYLSSFFKEQTGLYFSDFLEEIRMNSASNLLSEKEISINSIARTVGYSSVKAFSRAFKRVNGVSPSDYRDFTRS